jgi:hypothetical protein
MCSANCTAAGDSSSSFLLEIQRHTSSSTTVLPTIHEKHVWLTSVEDDDRGEMANDLAQVVMVYEG